MSRRVFQWSLLGYLAIMLYAGWMPLDFVWDSHAAQIEYDRGMAQWPLHWDAQTKVADVRVNLLVFVPVGLLAGLAYGGKWRWWTVPAVAMVLSSAASAAIEVGQLYLPGRIAGFSDWALNSLSGLAGGIVGVAAFSRTPRRFWSLLAGKLKGRPNLLAAGVLAMALAVLAAWPFRFNFSLVAHQWSVAQWNPVRGLAGRFWHEWIVRVGIPYAAMTLLLGSARDGGSSRRRALLAAMACLALATGLQAMRLVQPGVAPNLGHLLFAAFAIGLAAWAAPRLNSRRVELPSAVAVLAVAILAMWAHVAWLAGTPEASGIGRLPLWRLYVYENLSGLDNAAIRWSLSAALSCLLAFYLSLRHGWRLRYRMIGGAALAIAGLAGVEAIKALAWTGRLNTAAVVEQSFAAIGGAMAFAVLWRILDRRGVAKKPVAAYAGAERRA